ncbi:AMP binding protein [Roridomyces roridus]|uniref:AMP binding protein n=1 Tax=Roridomyces roridus TaxID=1738132 RepID=A0AAD7FNP1_9AGAR|nr:AMP binding protein [Roridomyces roridus]
MSPRVYESHEPDLPIRNMSIYTRMFGSHRPGDIGGFPSFIRAMIDAATGTTVTRGQLKTLTLSFAQGLRTHTATAPFAKRGDTLLIFSRNNFAWPVVLYGSIAAGLRCTLANSAYTSHELAYQYKDSGAKLVLTSEEGISTVRAMFAEMGLSKDVGDMRTIVLPNDLRWAGGPAIKAVPEAAGFVSLPDLLSRGALAEEEKFQGDAANETVLLCYSSGTTGKPKGVETTHQNLTTLVDIVKVAWPPLVPGEQPVLGILPLYHIYGVSNLLTSSFTIGAPVVIQTKFDPVAFCANIEKYKVAYAFVVPPVLVVLARHPAVDSHDLSSLEYMLSGAAPLGADLVKMVKHRLLSKRKPGAQCWITQGYGLTETSPSTHTLPFLESDRKVGSIGFLLPNLKARLVEDDDGLVDAEIGKPGELWIHGKTVMKGYLNNVPATRNAITPDGWFKTGDVAVRDKEGYYYIVDRRKELIKYKGFQVPPAELEAILLTHPDIADAAVIGVDSVEQATELPRAYVAHADPAKVATSEAKAAFSTSVVKWMESKVAKHKFLRGGVAVIETVPKSAAGKILRRQLRDLAKEEVARGEIQTSYKARL